MPSMTRPQIAPDALHNACAKGDSNEVRALVEQVKKEQARSRKKIAGLQSKSWDRMDGNVNVVDDSGRTPLHHAIEAGHLEIVRFLLKQGAKIDMSRSDKSTPCHIAAATGNVEVLRLLLGRGEKGPCLKALNDQGSTPLHLAAAGGHAKAVDYLLSVGAPVNSRRSYGNTPMHYAVINGHSDVVDLLLKGKADINHYNNRGSSVLHFASSRGHIDLVQKFCELGMDTNLSQNDGNTALHFAATHGHLDIVNMLIDPYGADADGQNALGNTSLHCAASSGNIAVVRTLVERGHASFAEAQNSGCTPLHFAAKEGCDEVCRYLVSVGAPLDAVDHDGQTVLHYSCLGGHTNVSTYLLEEGCDTESKSINGSTPLHCAATRGHPGIVRRLVERGASVNDADADGATPLHGACARGDPTVVRYLIDHGAFFNAVDADGDTPLHGAASMGHKEVVEMLIQQGADLTVANKLGCNPSLQAENAGHHEVADAIINSRDHIGKTPLFRLIEELGKNPPEERIKEIEDMVHDYIQCKADINIEVQGQTPLSLAIIHGYEDIAADLIKGGADTNHGNPLLLIATEVCKCDWQSGSPRDNFLHRTAELLVQYGADVNASIEELGTPMQMAMDASKENFAMMLVDSGARFDIDVFYRLLTELQYDSCAEKSERRVFIQHIMDALIRSHSLDISSPVTPGGATPLELAIQGNEPDIALKLITAGCDVGINNPLFSALDMVEQAGFKVKADGHEEDKQKLDTFLEVAMVIISRRPVMDVLVHGKSAFDRAIVMGHYELVPAMLENGADPNFHPYLITVLHELAGIRTEGGNHPNAEAKARYEFLESSAIALLEANASVNTHDENNTSPLELAIQAVSEPVVERLLKIAAAGYWPVRVQRVNVDKKNKDGETILIQVLKQMAEASHAEDQGRYIFLESVAMRLVAYGAEHSNALSIAIDAGHYKMVKMLLEKDVDVDVLVDVNGDQTTLLFKVLLELEHTRDPDQTRHGFLSEVAKEFIFLGANKDVRCDGRAMLDVAIACDNENLIDNFLESSNDIDMFDPEDGTTALYRLMAGRKKRLESGDQSDKAFAERRSDYVQHVAAKLLDKNTELHVKGQEGTLFDLARISGLWEVCSKILEQSSSYGFCDAGGEPFLHKLIDALADEDLADDDEAYKKLEAMTTRLIRRGCNVNQDWQGTNPLDKAIAGQVDAVIETLLDNNALYGRTILHTMIHALMRAEEEGDKDLCAKRIDNTLKFISKGADVDAEVDGVTPLTLSMDAHNADITKAIMDKSKHLHGEQGHQFMQRVLAELREGVADNRLSFMKYVALGLSDQNWPMLHELLHSVPNDSAVEIANFLIENDADVTQQNEYCHYDTALHAAAERGAKGIAIKLLRKGGPVILDCQNNRGETALTRAVMRRQLGMVDWLVNVGSDVNSRTGGAACRVAPLHIASTNLDHSVVELLLKATNIDVSAPGHWGRTPLHEALLQDDAADSDAQITLVQLLLDEGADPNAQDADGKTPLMLAALSGNLSTVKNIDQLKTADYSLLDTSGQSVFEYALEGKNHKVYDWLVRKYPLSEVQQKRLMIGALKMNMLQVVETLLERGGRYIVTDYEDKMSAVPISTQVAWEEPLFWATYFGHADTVENMLNQGCAVKDAVDSSGRNLYHWCSIWGLQCHSDCLAKLVKAPGYQECMNQRGPDGCTPFETAEAYGRSPNLVLLGGNPLDAPRHAFSFNEAVLIANSTGKKYTDMDFPANLDSLVHRQFKGHNKKDRFHNVEWCRPEEICDGMPRLDLASVTDPSGGPGANPWLLAAVAASHDGAHGIGHLFTTTEVNEIGAYEIVFTFGEEKYPIVIDDRIPCVNKVPFFGGLAKNNNIAFMLLEKAFAKLFGSYSGVTSGVISNKFKDSTLYKTLKSKALEEAVYNLVHSQSFSSDASVSKPTRVETMAQESIMYECLMLFQVSVVLGTSVMGLEGLLRTATMVSQWGELELDEPTLRLGVNEPISVLPGIGTRICKPPCVAIKANVKARVTFEFEDRRAADACRLVQSNKKPTAADIANGRACEWKRLWRHPVPDHEFNFSVQLVPSPFPYVMCFDAPPEGTSLAFEVLSDKELEIIQVEELDDLEMHVKHL
jgi:ankyrin repeat protein